MRGRAWVQLVAGGLLACVPGFAVRAETPPAPRRPADAAARTAESRGSEAVQSGRSKTVTGLAEQPAAGRGATRLELQVVGVHDGDTLTGLSSAKEQVKVRLDAIDAPELGQAFGQVSKKALSDKVFGRQVVVFRKTTDRYGRTIGHVLLDGRDVNLEMLEEGMAWHYKHFDHNARLAEAEASARAARKGLWGDAEPVPPWDWRQSRRDKTPAVQR